MSSKIRFNEEVALDSRSDNWIFSTYKSITVYFKLNKSVRFVPILTTVGPGMHRLPKVSGIIKVEREGSDVGELIFEVVR